MSLKPKIRYVGWPTRLHLKEALADLTLENRMLKKSMIADGGDDE